MLLGDYRLTACMSLIKLVVEKDCANESNENVDNEDQCERSTPDVQTARSKRKKSNVCV